MIPQHDDKSVYCARIKHSCEEMSSEKKEVMFSEDSKSYSEADGVQISRKQTTIERAVRSRSAAAASLAHELVSPEEMDKHDVSAYMPPVSENYLPPILSQIKV